MTAMLFSFICFAAISCGASQSNLDPSATSGCCIGTTSKCDTDDTVVCDRASTCEWTFDEMKCPEQNQPEPNPAPTDFAGCCLGTTSTCIIATEDNDKSLCDRTGTCWWSYDSTTCANSGGCCSGDAPECNVGDVESRCNRNGNFGCEWIEGADADCSSSSSTGSSSSERGSSGRGSSERSSSGRSGSSGSSSRRSGSSSSSSDRRGPGSEQSLFADVSVGEKEELSGIEMSVLAAFAGLVILFVYRIYRLCVNEEYKKLPDSPAESAV